MDQKENRRVFFRITDKTTAEKLDLMCYLTGKSMQDIMQFSINTAFDSMINNDPDIKKRVEAISKLVGNERGKL